MPVAVETEHAPAAGRGWEEGEEGCFGLSVLETPARCPGSAPENAGDGVGRKLTSFRDL